MNYGELWMTLESWRWNIRSFGFSFLVGQSSGMSSSDMPSSDMPSSDRAKF
jgi:hypothetical protein